MLRILTLASLALLLPGCIKGGGQTSPNRDGPDPNDVALPDGYRIELVADGLTFPVGITFDDTGIPYVVESGYSYGEVFTTPRVLRIDPATGDRSVIAEGAHPPWNGITHHRGHFYVSEGSQDKPGAILEIDLTGEMREVVSGLPSQGDHHTNGPVIGPDGFLYFGQGTATNSGIVGEDNLMMGWLPRAPEFHDIPCRDVTLTGVNYESDDHLNPNNREKVSTGPYLPFGTAAVVGQVIPGQVPCTGAVMRVQLPSAASHTAGGPFPVELYAWGFRNPFGLAFAPDGSLYVSDNGYDERGERPVFGSGDLLWKVEQGRWYGWPDYSGGRPLENQRFRPPLAELPKTLLQNPPEAPPLASAYLAVHSSSNGMDISRSETFGHVGEAFIAQFGDMSPGVGNVVQPVGFKVVRVDPTRGVVSDFAVNDAKANGPASYLNSGGLERPVAARFSPNGNTLWVVDFGVMTIGNEGPEPRQNTGRIWRIVHE
ncbi:MAG TPA: PQQ-dependent sugar dehydrogenase [Archangium sp.]